MKYVVIRMCIELVQTKKNRNSIDFDDDSLRVRLIYIEGILICGARKIKVKNEYLLKESFF